MKKSKTFARNLIAIVIAVIMAVSGFTGTVTAFAKSGDDFHDDSLAANFMTWAETTDNQTCEALLDWLDGVLQNVNLEIHLHYNYVVVNVDVDGYIDSVDGVFNLVKQFDGILSQYGGTVGGDIANVNLSAIANVSDTSDVTRYGNEIVSKCSTSVRAVNDAKTIVMALAKGIYMNSNDDTNSEHPKNGRNWNVIGAFVQGRMSLGLLNSALDIYGLIGNLVGIHWNESGDVSYQENLVYNVLAEVILNNTAWFTEAEKQNYDTYLRKGGSGGSTWNFDRVLMSKLSTELLQKISVNMTYSRHKAVDKNGDTKWTQTEGSEDHFKAIKAELDRQGKALTEANIAQASTTLGYDPNLRYDTSTGWIYLFRYGNEKLNLSITDKPYEAVGKAFKLAWKTVLQPTLGTLRVQNNINREGIDDFKDFDNKFYYWYTAKNGWNTDNWADYYTEANVRAWAADCIGPTGQFRNDFDSVDEFLDAVQNSYSYDRTVTEDAQHNWRDINSSTLFGKLRYSPMADKYFHMQTGPINLYFAQTGFSNLSDFIDDFCDKVGTSNPTYSTMIAALNDALVAAVKDFFPNSQNIGLGNGKNVVTTNLNRPNMDTVNTTNPGLIAQTIVDNAAKVFEYAANATDENILGAYYYNHSITNKTASNHLSEVNFEEAMIPFLISCIKNITATKSIHDRDWDLCRDAEGVGFVALREFLSYALPNKNYDVLVKTTNGYYEGAGNKDLYQDVILVMARDAVGYLLNSIVPCRDANGNVWDVYTSNVATDTTTLWDILNSVVCYYASTETFTEPSWNTTTNSTKGKALAALLGAVDSNGNCKVKMGRNAQGQSYLWENISNIANAIWPTIGTLQFGTTAKAGQADSYKLIYQNVVESLLNIGNQNPNTGKYGIATILQQLATIFTCQPIMEKDIIHIVYDDILVSLVNSVFGGRINGAYGSIIPRSTYYDNDSSVDTNNKTSSATPFDSLVQYATFAKYSGQDGANGNSNGNGIIGILLSNIYRYFGGSISGSANTVSGAGCWQGAMFAVKAVNFFIPSFVPQLGEHKFKAATISVTDPSRTVAAGTALQKTYLTIKNNATGLNRFYKNASGKVVADDRYFIRINSLTKSQDGENVALTYDNPAGSVLAPEQALRIEVGGNNPNDASLVTFTINYNVYRAKSTNGVAPNLNNATPIYSNQTAKCYLNFSTADDWAATTLTGSAAGVKYPQGNNVTPVTRASSTINIYKNIVIDNNNVGAVDEYGIYQSGNAFTGLYAMDTTSNGAYVKFDSKGNILTDNRFDYSTNGGETWNCGDSVVVGGKTLYKGLVQADVPNQEGVSTRPHIVINAADAGSLIKSTKLDDNFEYTEITVDPDVIIKAGATAATPTKGINFVPLGTTTCTWLKYDGTTTIDTKSYPMSLYGYIGTTPYALGTTNVVVANTNGKIDLENTYNRLLRETAPYQVTDYDDFNEGTGSSATYDQLQEALTDTVRNMSPVITATNADSLVSEMITVPSTRQTYDELGDTAYVPMAATTGSLSGTFLDGKATRYNGYWYLDKEHTIPIYQNTELTSPEGAADLTTDAVGQAVRKSADGTYYVVNTVKYEKKWDITNYSAPYYGDTTTPATETVKEWVNGEEVEVEKPLYNQIQYAYYNDAGMRVNWSDDWTFKYAITEEIIKPNESSNDYRGYYQKLSDTITYKVEEAKKRIDTSLLSTITEGVIENRKGMDSVNYDVATYEAFVKVAKEAESLVWISDYDDDDQPIYASNATKAEIQEAKYRYDKYKELVDLRLRNYVGNKLEPEIVCASGYAHDVLTTTPAVTDVTVDEKGNETTIIIEDAVIRNTSSNPVAPYGKYVNGVLTNLDDNNNAAYTEASWSNYVNALATADLIADAHNATIVDTYNAKKNLVIAEQELEVPAPKTTFEFSGSIVHATDITGTAGSTGIAAVILAEDGTRLGRASADGTFSVQVPFGTQTIIIRPSNGISRTITVTGDIANDVTGAMIGVVALDYNGDGKINSTDVALYSLEDNLFDITGTSNDAANSAVFKNIIKSGVNYAGLNL